jgi:hypothetical protein
MRMRHAVMMSLQRVGGCHSEPCGADAMRLRAACAISSRAQICHIRCILTTHAASHPPPTNSTPLTPAYASSHTGTSPPAAISHCWSYHQASVRRHPSRGCWASQQARTTAGELQLALSLCRPHESGPCGANQAVLHTRPLQTRDATHQITCTAVSGGDSCIFLGLQAL